VGNVACVRQKVSAHKVGVGNPGAKRRLGRSGRRWWDNTECVFGFMVHYGLDSFGSG
jgi:hypothetical protein